MKGLVSQGRCRSDVDSRAELVTSVYSVASKLFFDTKDLVELRKTLRTGRGTSFLFLSVRNVWDCWSRTHDLTGAKTDNDVRDSDILGLSGAVGNHYTPASGVRILRCLDGLGNATDLVDLEKESVASLVFDGLLDANGVCHSQIITRKGQYSTEESLIVSGQTYPTIWKSEVLKK